MSATAFWRCFHWLSMQNSKFHTEHNTEQFINRLKEVYNDNIINEEWEAKNPDEDYIEWSLRLHNKTNARKNQYSNWDRTDFHIAQKNFCDICENKEFIFFFPWKLVHQVAKQTNDNTLAINTLMELNNIYPCDNCKGTLFSDTPQENEPLTDWAKQQNRKFNISKNRPEEFMIPVEIPPEILEPQLLFKKK